MKKLLVLSLCSFLVYIQNLNAQTQARFYTSLGTFDVELREDLVPITANNFIDLTNQKFYDNTLWHRVVANFVIQGGDPTGTGSGGPGYTIQDEYHPLLSHNMAGALSMANAGPGTTGSQFFVTLSPQPQLDNSYNMFGTVISGWATVDTLGKVPTNGNGTPIFAQRNDSIRIISASAIVDPGNQKAILGGNFPNPFTNSTQIAYGLFEQSPVTLRIFDSFGKMIAEFDLGTQDYGDHLFEWKTTDQEGNNVPAGIYFYQMETPDVLLTKTMIKMN